MPKIKMTIPEMRKLKPTPGKQVDYFDTVLPGLVCRVSYGGSRTWLAVHYDDQKVTRWFRLGRYEEKGADEIPLPETGQEWPRDLSLEGARKAARLFYQHKDTYLRGAKSDKARVSAQWTFDAVAEQYLLRRAAKLRSKKEMERILRKYVIPVWKGRKVVSIMRGDGKELHEKIVEENGARQADAAIAIVRAVLKWVEEFENYYTCPVKAQRTEHSSRDEDGRERVLDPNEIRMIWAAAGDMGTFGALVKILLLTAQRREKVTRMRWTELDGDLWHIPKEPREKANAGTLRLPSQAIEIIAQQPRIAGNTFVFAGRLDGKPINGFSKAKKDFDDLLPDDFAHWTLHDLRRTARSMMTDLGISERIAEQVLGHKIKGVERVYNRSLYIQQKGDALSALANYISQLIDPAPNVVTLGIRRKDAPAP
ncbi:site-specific integrase [Bradyrhizobium japonicum]|uniref:tyrosine-type recombinase/integrase n=1 Tax=Bradyrhizobium japonicum TaxID=375 RepID=UPI001BA821F4|nr:site-specific integrase [Bradyrhizobium japonicum]MBR0994921.1 site-specific integrase [Bradyrhizobium japonicum]